MFLNRVTGKESKDADMNGDEKEGRALGAKTKRSKNKSENHTGINVFCGKHTTHMEHWAKYTGGKGID